MTPVRLGDELDNYRIEGVAARSGMASIFRGTDLRTGSPVAIKVPHPEMECDPAFFERFHREEEIGQEMDHPGVMKVMRNPQRSRVYMVMEWLDGRLLRQILTPKRSCPASGPSGSRYEFAKHWITSIAAEWCTAISNRRTSWSMPKTASN